MQERSVFWDIKKILWALLLLPVCLLSAQKYFGENIIKDHYPGKAWEYLKDVSGQGWDMKKLDAVRQFIVDSANTTGMIVVHHGRIVFSFGDIEELSYIASCRKSVLAMLYGPFVENGKINLNETLGQLGIDDINGLLPIEKKATIQNLLNARSGVYHNASYPGDERAIAPHRGTVDPGSLFLYNNWDFNLAGYIFEKLSGVNIYQAVDSMLVKPLYMEDWDMTKQHKEGDSTRSMYPAYPMWFSTRDMARIGYLMLHDGRWNDQQIISPTWVHTITTPVTTFKDAATYRGISYKNFGYGYLWWIWDQPNDVGVFKSAYTAQGAYGQFITVLPALDLVVAHKTNNKYERSTTNYYDILDRLIAANDSFALIIKQNQTSPTIITNEENHPTGNPTNHHPSSPKMLAAYTGEYTSPELHVNFKVEVRDGKLSMDDIIVNDVFPLDETDKDLFMSQGQKYLFQRSIKTKEIIGFTVKTKGLPDKPFVKIK
ncbi:MAG: serine hydrolase [Saprospiraceae bacterium]